MQDPLYRDWGTQACIYFQLKFQHETFAEGNPVGTIAERIESIEDCIKKVNVFIIL